MTARTPLKGTTTRNDHPSHHRRADGPRLRRRLRWVEDLTEFLTHRASAAVAAVTGRPGRRHHDQQWRRAQDKALRLLPRGHQLTGQLAMMLVMVGYTFTGLYSMFGG